MAVKFASTHANYNAPHAFAAKLFAESLPKHYDVFVNPLKSVGRRQAPVEVHVSLQRGSLLGRNFVGLAGKARAHSSAGVWVSLRRLEDNVVRDYGLEQETPPLEGERVTFLFSASGIKTLNERGK